MSPLASNPLQEIMGDRRDSRGSRESWESEMSVDSLTSINSILSEEGSITSAGSFTSDTADGGRKAYDSLSCLLDSVPPPSNTPDSMVGDIKAVDTKIITGMGSKFKLQLQEIEARKRDQGKHEQKGVQDIRTADTLNTQCTLVAPTLGSDVAPTISRPLNSDITTLNSDSLTFSSEITTLNSESLNKYSDNMTLRSDLNSNNAVLSTATNVQSTSLCTASESIPSSGLNVLNKSICQSVHGVEKSTLKEVKSEFITVNACFGPVLQHQQKRSFSFTG